MAALPSSVRAELRSGAAHRVPRNGHGDACHRHVTHCFRRHRLRQPEGSSHAPSERRLTLPPLRRLPLACRRISSHAEQSCIIQCCGALKQGG